MSNIEISLDTAFQAYNNHQFDIAENLVRDVLTISPTNGDALYLLGLIAYRSGALEPSEKLLYDAVKLYPQNENYALALASVLQKAGRLDEALSFYVKYPENASALAQTGYVYLQKGQNDFALSAFTKAIEKNKYCLPALIGKALILRQKGAHFEALKALQEIYKIGTDVELEYQLSVQYRLCDEPENALKHIDSALSMEQTASFLNEKGLICEKLKHYDEAQKAYEDAISLNPYAPDSFANLGNLYFRNENYRRAEDYYKKALALDDEFLNAHHNLAITLCKQGREAEGLEHYRSALLINKNHIPSLYNLAMILEERGDYSEAAGLYFNILALKANPPFIEFRISDTLAGLYQLGKKEKKDALNFAKGWVKHFPESKIAEHTLNALTHQLKDKSLILSYAKTLYDSFADTYDEKMAELEAKALQKVVDYFNQKKEDDLGDILDLACGTGSLALRVLKKYNMTGVDISEPMLTKAREKRRYKTLHHTDVISFLNSDEQFYDYVVAIELTGYLSEIEEFIGLIKNHLKPNGTFVMSIENAQTDKIYLSEQGRYFYLPSYVMEILHSNGFSVKSETLNLRKEGFGNAYAEGTLYFATLIEQQQ